MRTNCLVFAVRLWFRHGGYLLVRKSRHGWWPHFLWAPTLDGMTAVVSYVPDPPLRWEELSWWRKVMPIHILFFHGKVRVGDDDPRQL